MVHELCYESADLNEHTDMLSLKSGTAQGRFPFATLRLRSSSHWAGVFSWSSLAAALPLRDACVASCYSPRSLHNRGLHHLTIFPNFSVNQSLEKKCHFPGPLTTNPKVFSMYQNVSAGWWLTSGHSEPDIRKRKELQVLPLWRTITILEEVYKSSWHQNKKIVFIPLISLGRTCSP